MIKVEHTKTLELNRQEDGWHWSGNLATDAELVLVEYSHGTTPNKAGEICKFPYGFNIAGQDDMGYPVIKPIAVSHTEKIEEGDWVYIPGSYEHILKVGNGEVEISLDRILNPDEDDPEEVFKIVALPEHFSQQQLQDIVDGRLKEGKLVVECEINENIPEPHNCEVIKLNPHITIYPVEETCPTCGKDGKFCSDSFHKGEKLHSFTGKELAMFEAIKEALSELTQLADGYENDYVEYKEWFEQNVK